MHKLLLVFFFTVCFSSMHAQVFSGSAGVIPDNQSIPSEYPAFVTGIGRLSATYGVATICINITHPFIGDLEIKLKAPDGTVVPLSMRNGGAGDNYSATCFSRSAQLIMDESAAPFTGSYIPDGYLGLVNNGQNADGVWKLCVRDIKAGDMGTVTAWSINFTGGLSPGPAPCANNLPPADDCSDATAVCSFYSHCGMTAQSYTAESWTGLDDGFCGTVQNNAFLKFVASAYEMNFNVWVTSSTHYDGIQIFFFDGNCGSGSVNNYGCYSPIRPGASPSVISATGLTVGNIYFMMIDGFDGDECNYIIEGLPSNGALHVSANAPEICAGEAVILTATGGNNIYNWNGPALHASTGNSVTATPGSAASYTVSSTEPGGMCPVTKNISIGIRPTSPQPIIHDTFSFCQHSVPFSLHAEGVNLLWYTTAQGGIGSGTPITPSTNTPGNFIYYVTQNLGCEGGRAEVPVEIKQSPDLGDDRNENVCYSGFINLSKFIPPDHSGLLWMSNGAPVQRPDSVTRAGIYMAIETNSQNCSDSIQFKIVVRPKLYIDAGKDTVAVRGKPIQLHCTAAASYQWSPSAVLNNAYSRTPVAILRQDQQFIVVAKDAEGCSATDSINVKLIQGTTYYTPTAFTPNNDGLNDIFEAIPVGISQTKYFKVFNRYGIPVFQTNDPFNHGWDGTFLGAPQAPGTYTWCINGIDIYGRQVILKGTVVLIR